MCVCQRRRIEWVGVRVQPVSEEGKVNKPDMAWPPSEALKTRHTGSQDMFQHPETLMWRSTDTTAH